MSVHETVKYKCDICSEVTGGPSGLTLPKTWAIFRRGSQEFTATHICHKHTITATHNGDVVTLAKAAAEIVDA